MEKNIAVIALIALIVGLGAGYAVAGNKVYQPEVTGGHMMPNGMMMGSAMDMQGEMDSMLQGLSGKTADAFDQAFLSEMIVHHEGAVQMAVEALRYAKHQEIKDLAQKIITAQNAEIREMQDWQKSWYGAQQ